MAMSFPLPPVRVIRTIIVTARPVVERDEELIEEDSLVRKAFSSLPVIGEIFGRMNTRSLTKKIMLLASKMDSYLSEDEHTTSRQSSGCSSRGTRDHAHRRYERTDKPSPDETRTLDVQRLIRMIGLINQYEVCAMVRTALSIAILTQVPEGSYFPTPNLGLVCLAVPLMARHGFRIFTNELIIKKLVRVRLYRDEII